ncbi:MAG: DedA family protein [Gammaproteobacteria bacterium]|nr:DedA family protein [Gammaproteobacteria bacterium]
MTEWFTELLGWIEGNPSYAGWVVFSVALAESLAIVGVLVPGVIILFGAGTLIGAGILDFWSMCAWAVAGAIIGDGLSFWLGHHFEYLTERWRWFRLHPDHLQRGVDFFRKYGDLSIALGRFFGPIRAIVPLVAGLMRMSPRRFYTANVLSALVWAPAYLLPGMLLGNLGGDSANWEQLLFPAGGIALIVVAWWLFHRYEQRRVRSGQD